MGRFVTGETKEIRADWWGEAENVTIREWTVGQRDKLNAEIIRVAGVAGEATEIEIRAAQVPVLIAGIAKWSFSSEDGKAVPVNRHWISQLKSEDADFIVSEIWELNRGRSAEEQESFRDDG